MNDTTRPARLAFDTPLGRLVALAVPQGLLGLYFDDQRDLPDAAGSDEAPEHPLLQQVRREIGEYCAGVRGVFTLPLAPAPTPFQQRVREGLLAVGAGRTTTYGDLARAIGSPRGFRAVAQALGRNPLIIVVPCHRVLAHGGALGGFSSGGPARKRVLLGHEMRYWPPELLR
ncbi:methylated-DNA--[protein]-cysteine S-methyltransferase [Pseudothauera rhizosphaerae]|uniref:methylated-DNA--[protein]-cysteine S-methyltransferase n=1 Tax=Pseudothauera rhizosphaerae TaxID=2565932 RepID=A0A4V3WBR3_9RHOO|nr:methylated-DNA--[protein]-cysteine S-methyltransferase [Pseudothauera rhizosphaerae]THF64276.1 methylated-DNA--[protein]-cysteine S-methyltransferase [Pseudothauera rhizosphaerae]